MLYREIKAGKVTGECWVEKGRTAAWNTVVRADLTEKGHLSKDPKKAKELAMRVS